MSHHIDFRAGVWSCQPARQFVEPGVAAEFPDADRYGPATRLALVISEEVPVDSSLLRRTTMLAVSSAHTSRRMTEPRKFSERLV
jgi:hypothetical protein